MFAKKGKYDADDIPAATQIFTPNWIVKYMVQNTIGGVLGGKEMLPENHCKYYVDTPEEPTAICHDIEDMKVLTSLVVRGIFSMSVSMCFTTFTSPRAILAAKPSSAFSPKIS